MTAATATPPATAPCALQLDEFAQLLRDRGYRIAALADSGLVAERPMAGRAPDLRVISFQAVTAERFAWTGTLSLHSVRSIQTIDDEPVPFRDARALAHSTWLTTRAEAEAWIAQVDA